MNSQSKPSKHIGKKGMSKLRVWEPVFVHSSRPWETGETLECTC